MNPGRQRAAGLQTQHKPHTPLATDVLSVHLSGHAYFHLLYFTILKWVLSVSPAVKVSVWSQALFLSNLCTPNTGVQTVCKKM